MKSKGLSGPMIRKNLSRYWLLFPCALVVLFLRETLFLSYLSVTSLDTQDRYLSLHLHQSTAFEVLFPVCTAVCVYSYLHKRKNSFFFHSLPCTRDDLFLSSYGCGMLFYLLPWAVVTGFTACMIPTARTTPFPYVTDYLQLAAYQLILYAVFFSISSFAMVLCGRSFFGAVTALVLPWILPLTDMLFRISLEPFLYGISRDGETLSESITPQFLVMGHYMPFRWGKTGIFAAGAVLLSYVTLRLHRLRPEEGVGQTLVFPRLLSMMQYVLTYLISWLLLLILSLLFPDLDLTFLSVYSLLLLGFPAFFLAKRILLRTIKVFQKQAILPLGIYTLCLGGLLFAFQFDLFGIVRKVPKAPAVQEVCLSLDLQDYVIRDPAAIQKLIDIHSHIIEERETLRQEAEDEDFSSDIFRYDYGYSYTLSLTYTMENGRTLHRTYPLSYHWEDGESRVLWSELEAFFREDHRAVEQLRQVEEITETVEYNSGTIMSTAEAEAFFRALEKDLEANLPALPLLEITGSNTDDPVVIRTKTGLLYRLDISRFPAPNAIRCLRELEKKNPT